MLTFRDFTDGSSNVIAIGEKRLGRPLGTYMGDDNEGYSDGWDWDSIRQSNLQPAFDPLTSANPDARFGSTHVATFNAVFCDGSVRNISYNIDGNLFNALGRRNDGQTVSAP